MQLKTMSDVRTKALAAELWGNNLAADEALAEVLRSEVTARRQCQRASTISRAISTLAPLVEVSKDRLSSVCETLEAQGDFSLAAGGVLHSTPLRAVELESGVWRIVSSLPTRHLHQRLPGSFQSTGVRRQLVFFAADGKNAEQALKTLGGVKLSAEAWAGLELAPVANQGWLAGLDERLKWLPEAAGSLERDGELEWQALSLNSDGLRWRRRPEAPAKIWKARTGWGYWLHAWTGCDKPPSTAVHVTLSADDANRTVFALARTLRQPIQVQVVDDADMVVIGIREWLPRAEYRYLSTVASLLSRESYMNRWAIPLKRAEEVLSTLNSRLGVVREEP